MNNLFDKLSPYFVSLPIGEAAGKIADSLRSNPLLVVTAPPGSGKSTLLPFVVLGGLPQGKVLMLEPRRLAARGVAERMAQMIGEAPGGLVGYRVRFETRVSRQTRIEVVTEGILERMLVEDPTLEEYGAVIFDEFHERSLSSDLCLALTMQARRLIRPDLQIVVMSATIDAANICRYLEAPLITATGKMYPVEIVYGSDIAPEDSAREVARAVAHALRTNSGDILAFLPGRSEILKCRELLTAACPEVLVMPLYGLLPPREQQLTLRPSPDGRRKVVLATPVAETSLTIEGITTVVDSGLCRANVFEPAKGLSHLETRRISLDMADQRSGRAGRLCPGVCYRLWSRPSQALMQQSRHPEIESADLAPMLLSIAAWGESNPLSLPWLTPPPPSAIALARKLLLGLEAIDSQGIITPFGRRLSALPCHPRIGAMLVRAGTPALQALAADIAAILEEKDPLGDTEGADISIRILALRSARRRSQPGRWQRISDIARQYRRIVGAPEDNNDFNPCEAGRLIALAFPERVAMTDGLGIFRLACGERVSISSSDDLSELRLLAVATHGKRIFLAAPLSETDAAAMGRHCDNLSWDSRQGRIIARRELRLGALTLADKPLTPVPHDKVMEILCQAALKDGRSMFDFGADFQRMHLRIATLAGWHRELELPETDADSLLARAAEWLPLYAGKATSCTELRKIDMSAVVWGLLSYEQQQAAERLAPDRIRLPGGRSVRVDYRQGAEVPVVSARLQDCLGMTETPRLDGGRCPVLMELLSPGFKPVQLTRDLAGFWSTTYFEVRKELRRRYPKHRWPDDPLASE